MTELRPAPSFDRAAVALICAALTVSVLMGARAAITGSGVVLGVVLTTITFFVAAPCAVILAAPAYLLLRKRFPDRWWTSALCGGLFAAVPYPGYWLVVGIVAGVGKADLLNLSLLAGELFLMGSVSGVVFHAIVTRQPRSSV